VIKAGSTLVDATLVAVTRRGTIRCLLAAALFGLSTPAASRLADDMSVFALAGLLYLGAALAVAPFCLRRRPDRGAVARSWRPISTAVVAGGAVGPVLLVAGLARTEASTASIMLNLELAATVVLAAAFFHEHLGGRVVVAAALVTAAGALLVWEPGASLDVGALLVAGACVCWGLDNCVTAGIDKVAPEQVVFLKGAAAGSVNLVLGLTVAAEAGAALAGSQVVAALAIGALGYGASITLWVKGARDLGAARGQVIFATAPFLGALAAWTVLDERIDGTQVAATVLAAIGVVVSLRSAHSHRHGHDAVAHDHEHRHDDAHHDHAHGGDAGVVHSHAHDHVAVVHRHPHVPDLHHRHPH
jgi:drug/metabolite transporter (DMT)-like permease